VRASQRERLIEAMTEVIAEKGYASVTIGDIVTRARIARRTFYEHFDDKVDCALAAFDRSVDDLLGTIAARFDPSLDQSARADAVIRGFLEFLAANPNLAWTYFVEVNAIGPEGVAARLEVHRRIAAMIVALRAEVGRRQPGTPPLGDQHALAVVGALHEIYEQALHERGPERLVELADDVVPLTVAMLEMQAPLATRRRTSPEAPSGD
jgi:AcrR family transcriptional regulator